MPGALLDLTLRFGRLKLKGSTGDGSHIKELNDSDAKFEYLLGTQFSLPSWAASSLADL